MVRDVLRVAGRPEAPGFFRISLTASDDMIERGLPGFVAALQEAESSMAEVAG